MTRKERLEAVVNREISEELIEDCRKELEKLDVQRARAKEALKESDRYKENQLYGGKICEVLTGEPVQIEELGELIGSTLTRQRLSAICTNLVREGKIKVCEVKVKNKGKRKAYYV